MANKVTNRDLLEKFLGDKSYQFKTHTYEDWLICEDGDIEDRGRPFLSRAEELGEDIGIWMKHLDPDDNVRYIGNFMNFRTRAFSAQEEGKIPGPEYFTDSKNWREEILDTKKFGVAEDILLKYFGNEKMKAKFEHSIDVGNCAYLIAKLAEERSGLEIDPIVVGSIGYVHDIGYTVRAEKHELETVKLLIKEGFPITNAELAMHGQGWEQFPEDTDHDLLLPKGYEGKILTLADMSMDPKDGVIAVEDRAERIKSAVRGAPDEVLPLNIKEGICNGMDNALPRFKQYRDELFELMRIDLPRLQSRFRHEYQE
jgi:hypothetical protein